MIQQAVLDGDALTAGAVQREYQKLGRLTLVAEFGHYLDLLNLTAPPARRLAAAGASR